MNADGPLPESNEDRQLCVAFADAAVPPTPASLPFRVRQRLRRRQRFQRACACIAVLALLATSGLTWHLRPWTGANTEVALPREGDPAPGEAERPMPVYLRSAPPVDPLDLLARQQAAYLTVLDQMEKEF